MSFRGKLMVGLLVVGLVPLLVLGVLSYFTSRAELRDTITRLSTQAAEELALSSARMVENSAESLRLAAGYIPFDQLSAADLGTVLLIPYRQIPAVSILAVFEASGRTVAPPVFRRAGDTVPELADREVVSAADLDHFGRHLPPLAMVLERGLVVGPPYRAHDDRGPRVAVCIRLATEPVEVLAAELSLTELEQRLADLGAIGRAYLVGADQEPFAASHRGWQPSPGELRLISAALAGGGSVAGTVDRADDGDWLATASVVPRLGWAVVTAQPSEVAFRAANRVRLYTMMWVGLAALLIIAVGLFLARGLTRPIAVLSEAVHGLAQGDYRRRAVVRAHDELGRFAATFNQMASEIESKDDEIRRWNRDLQRRVEERTTALKAAQDQILRSQKLTALGTLGAGIAHELNNPVTGIMGILTFLKRDLTEDPDKLKLVNMAWEQANRVANVVADFQRFAESEVVSAGEPVSVVKIVKSATARLAESLTHGIGLCLRFGPDLPLTTGSELQLEQALWQVAQNAVDAMPGGGRLGIDVGTVDGEAIQITVADTGTGILPEHLKRIFDPFFTTKKKGDRVGMGLTLAHKAVTASNGRIELHSTIDIGTTATIILPARASRAHLE